MISNSIQLSLSYLIAVPFISALLLFLLLKNTRTVSTSWILSTLFALVTLAGTVAVLLQLDGGVAGDLTKAGMQLQERYAWIPSLGVEFSLGIDAISGSLLFLSSIITLLVVCSSKNASASYHGLVHLLQGTVFGALCSTDLILYYIFWELLLLPAFFLIGCFGGKKRIQATVQFFIYTALGSLVMLAAIAFLGQRYYLAHNELNFSIAALSQGIQLTAYQEKWLCLAFLLAFLIKVPVVPLHGWLPLAYTESRYSTTALLSGVLSKLGLYGIIRFCFVLFPRGIEELSPLLMGLGAVSVVYGALVALSQTEAKKMLAYASISHLGFCVLGVGSLTTGGQTGALFLMISHGLTSAGLFLLLEKYEERFGVVSIAEDAVRSNAASRAPRLSRITFFVLLGSLAVPLTSGFVGEFLILSNSFAVSPFWCSVALLGVVLGAVYSLRWYRIAFFGSNTNDTSADPAISDISGVEKAIFLPLCVLILLLGIMPARFLQALNQPISKIEAEREVRKELRASTEMELEDDTGSIASAMEISDTADTTEKAKVSEVTL